MEVLLKDLRAGDQRATVIAIGAIKELDLHNQANLNAIKELGGLETLLNLIDTEDLACRKASLGVLKDISWHGNLRCVVVP